MSKQTYDNQVITQYLLGTLPAAECERLDELSFTDDEFADSLSVAEKELVDAYAQGELAGAALEQFKSHYLASPLRREKVAFARALQVFAEREAAGIRVKPVKTTFGQQRWFAALSTFIAARPIVQWGFAAAVLLLLIGGGWLAVDNSRLRQQMSQTAARKDALVQRERELQKEIEAQRSADSVTEQELARVRNERERLEQELKKLQPAARPSPGEDSIVSVILAPPLRGGGQVSTVAIKPGTNLVAARLQLDAADYSTYRVALIDPAGNQALWRSGSLNARARGAGKALGVTFPAGLLKPQNYILRVSGVPAGGVPEIVSDYSFRVVR